YDYGTMSGSVTSMGHGYWSLMSYGSWGKKTAAEAMGTTPSYPDAYNLFKYGFVTPGTLDNSENAVLNAPLDIYLLRSATNVNQYFLIQPRKYGTTDNYDRGAFYRIDNSANSSRGGLLIFHVDESVPLVRINDKPGHYRVAIEEAHGGEQKLQQTLNKDYGDLNDLWGPNKKEFSPTSDPSTGLYSAFTYNMLAPSQDTPSGLQLSGITWNSSSGNSAFTMNTTLATISGKIASYNPGVLTTIQLKKNETVAYSTFIQATSGYGQIEQSFSIAGVVPDTYDLTIIKAAHTKFTIKNLIVTSQNLNLTSDKRPEIQLMNLRCGDINGDGIINNDDLIILWNTANYNKISALATNKACDLNGDGVVNNLDLTILWQTYNYNRGEIIIDY
ncbi:MAG: dockerin type I domain-containing protein, partial [Firmicutes bacterium]|nr:dockerin type I domain-containing protein [Bacillota bacterium]